MTDIDVKNRWIMFSEDPGMGDDIVLKLFYDEVCRRAEIKALNVVRLEGTNYAAVKMAGCHFDSMNEIMKELKLL